MHARNTLKPKQVLVGCLFTCLYDSAWSVLVCTNIQSRKSNSAELQLWNELHSANYWATLTNTARLVHNNSHFLETTGSAFETFSCCFRDFPVQLLLTVPFGAPSSMVFSIASQLMAVQNIAGLHEAGRTGHCRVCKTPNSPAEGASIAGYQNLAFLQTPVQ